MAQKNDDRIMRLKEEIAEKKAELASKQGRFYPVTNCILVLDGHEYNLHVEANLKLLHVRLHSYCLAAKDLGIDPAEVYIGSYTLLEWLDDINQQREVHSVRQKKVQLEKLERQLDALLSNDKKTELEIDSIAELLK